MKGALLYLYRQQFSNAVIFNQIRTDMLAKLESNVTLVLNQSRSLWQWGHVVCASLFFFVISSIKPELSIPAGSAKTPTASKAITVPNNFPIVVIGYMSP